MCSVEIKITRAMLLICFFKPRLLAAGLKGVKFYNILLSLNSRSPLFAEKATNYFY